MSEFFKISCEQCGQRIECPTELNEQAINCPSCNLEQIAFQPNAEPRGEKRMRPMREDVLNWALTGHWTAFSQVSVCFKSCRSDHFYVQFQRLKPFKKPNKTHKINGLAPVLYVESFS